MPTEWMERCCGAYLGARPSSPALTPALQCSRSWSRFLASVLSRYPHEVPHYPHKARCWVGQGGQPAGVGYWVDPAEPEPAPELLCPHRRA